MPEAETIFQQSKETTRYSSAPFSPFVSHPLKIHHLDTAHGYEDRAQVNPPGGDEQPDDSPLPTSLLELVDPHENEDISLEVSLSPQEGQITLSCSSEGKINCSKIFPHLLHSNS